MNGKANRFRFCHAPKPGMRLRAQNLLFSLVVAVALMSAVMLMTAHGPVAARGALMPKIGVNYAHNWVDVNEAAANTTVTITIAGKGEKTGQTDENGHVWISEWDPPIQPGDEVTVENEGVTRTLKVGEIGGTVDYDKDKVTGVVNAAWISPTLVSVNCEIWVEQGPPPVIVDGVNPAGGGFECDFSGVWDIQLDQTVGVVYETSDGDRVMNGLNAPWVRVQAGHDWVGADYEAGHTFWITVTDSANNVKATAQIDTQPNAGWQGDGFQSEPEHWTPGNPDIQAGDWVHFRADDGYTNTVRVGEIAGVVDVDADLVSGTIQAAWFAPETLDVECHPWGGWEAGWQNASVVNSTAAADGSSSYTCQWDPQTEWDVAYNQNIAVFYHIPGRRDLVGNVFWAAPPAGPRYVTTTGADEGNDCRDAQSPCAAIQHAIDQAADGDEIRVAGGTYTENLVINHPVKLMGGYESANWTRDPAQYETIIDGSNSRTIFGKLTPGEPSQGAKPVVRFEPESGESVLDGFTITGGDVLQDGGGVTIVGASPRIRACVIRGNHAVGLDAWGGGGLLIGEGASPVIEDSLIMGNSADNGAGAVRVGGASFTMINTLVAGNSGAPAIHANDASITLTNVILTNNGSTPGIWLNRSRAEILNSILWEEEGQDIGVDTGGNFVITFSNVEDAAPPGQGNISKDPMFVDPTHGNYRLRRGSPAIDAGTNQGAPDHDLDGLARPFDGDRDGDAVTDMGAYEFTEHRLHFPLVLGLSQPASGM